MQINDKKYAAIIIPTLNRKKHLERCINSLKRNAEAKNTELYISVDYPPSKKYEQGYDEIKKYVKTISGFKNVNIFFQTKNLGPGLNRAFLEQQLRKDGFNRYIFTDDDNEFSCNFLAYMNWGLERYEYDTTVYAICSKADFGIDKNGLLADFFLISAYNPYGSGHWLNKNELCREYLQESNIEKIRKSFRSQRKLVNVSPNLLNCLGLDLSRDCMPMRGKRDNITYIDIWENIYCILNDKKCLIPFVAKSRNWGNDGSGIHSKSGESENYIPEENLDESYEWSQTPVRSSGLIEEKTVKMHAKKFSISKGCLVKCYIKFFLYGSLGRKKYTGLIRLLRCSAQRKKNTEAEIFYG